MAAALASQTCRYERANEQQKVRAVRNAEKNNIHLIHDQAMRRTHTKQLLSVDSWVFDQFA